MTTQAKQLSNYTCQDRLVKSLKRLMFPIAQHNLDRYQEIAKALGKVLLANPTWDVNQKMNEHIESSRIPRNGGFAWAFIECEWLKQGWTELLDRKQELAYQDFRDSLLIQMGIVDTEGTTEVDNPQEERDLVKIAKFRDCPQREYVNQRNNSAMMPEGEYLEELND